jgi:Zn-dependent peptidase ImmA (M78 family)
MRLRERYNYLHNLLEKAKEEYANNPQFSTELEIISLKEECQQLLSKIDDEEQYLYPRDEINFYTIYPYINGLSMKLIKDLGDETQLPIDVEKIALLCGFEGIELDDGNRSGRHAVARNNIIYVNKDEPDEEQRFSIAHEIGHKILDSRKDITMKDVARKGNHWKADILLKQSPVSEEEEETLLWEEIIDYFAANLLMPTHFFKDWSSQSDEQIAEKFHVSEKSLRKRRIEIAREIQE